MNILDSFANTKVLVIGDVMLDRYWWGSVSRISPEAPVPAVKMDTMTLAAGGSANVAANVAGLGASPILVGIIGDDAEGEMLPEVLSNVGVSHEQLIKIKGARRPSKLASSLTANKWPASTKRPMLIYQRKTRKGFG